MKTLNVPQNVPQIKNFTILLSDGNAINQTTKLFKQGERFYLDTPEKICLFIKKVFLKESNSKSFSDWANSLNESGEYEGTFTKYDALDSLASNNVLNISGKNINLYDYFITHLPFKN